MKHVLKASLIAGLLLPSVFLSCSKSSTNSQTPPAAVHSVRLSSSATFGSILTDSAGNTLYFFSVDATGQSGCTGGCLAAWPVFYSANPTLDTGLASADFGVITRSDGTPQTTYKGWPLYYYAQDVTKGDINGDDVGKVWFVAKPDYTVMLAEGPLKGADSLYYDTTYTAGAATDVEYLTDPYGRTLYSFSFDKLDTNNYTASDFSNNTAWPIFQVSAVGKVPSLLSASSFTTINVFGKTQLTFNGWPLYNFGEDNQQRGHTFGVSVPSPGIWPVARPTSPQAPL
jgi:predicted lipoprotein with Yx(FWY)xxD motif